MERILILGVGNPILSDDRIGLLVVEKLASTPLNTSDIAEVSIGTATEGGLEFMEKLEGYDRAIVIDAMMTGELEVGEIRELKLDDLQQTSNLLSSHGIDLRTAVEFGRNIGTKMPEKIRIFGIEISDNLTVSEDMAPRVEAAADKAVQRIAELISNLEDW
jgi:hydrogenase maturation protease